MELKLLFVMNVPPPFHGTTIMNSYLLDYFRRKGLDYLHLPVEGSKDHHELGKFNKDKVINALRVLKGIYGARKKYAMAYLIMSVDGFAFYRHCLFVLLLLMLNKKVILHLRGIGFSRKRGIQRVLANYIFRRSYLVQHTSLNRFDLKGYHYKAIYDVPNGWPDSFSKYQPYRNPHREVTHIIFLSNLIESKGFFVLLEAISKIRAHCNACRFHFIGNWRSEEIKSRFYAFIKEHNIEEFIGEVGPKYNEEKYMFLANMDMLVFPTFYEYETWGNVNLEAMMFELPVIATRVAGIPEMIKPGVNGYLIEPKDVSALAEHLVYLIEHPQVREEFGKEGRRIFLKHFTLDHFEDQMHQVFLQVQKN